MSGLLDSIAILFPCHNSSGSGWVGDMAGWRNNAVYPELVGVKYVMILWECHAEHMYYSP